MNSFIWLNGGYLGYFIVSLCVEGGGVTLACSFSKMRIIYETHPH